MVNLTMLVRDRPNLTRQTLDSLVQSGALEGNTLTILDDRSLNATKVFLEEWSHERTNVNLVRNDGPIGTGEARNEVIAHSEACWGRGDLLYLSDNDVYFSHGWLACLTGLYGLAFPQFAAIGAYNHPFNAPFSFTKYAGRYRVGEVMALSTQSMLMDWRVFDRYGPFCTTPVDRVCQSEDVDLSNHIRADGKSVGVIDPWLAIGTGITNTFGQPIPGWELVKSQVPLGIIYE